VNLQQLRYLCAVVDHGMNVSLAAEALFTSQPGISKQIRQLEDELGVPIFVRQGKRLAALTAGGEVIVATARRALQELNNLKRVGAEFKAEDTGTLAIATTHTQARYVLPAVLTRFSERYPKVRLLLHQGNPLQVAQQTSRAEVDVGIATEALADFRPGHAPLLHLESLRTRAQGAPMVKAGTLTLEALARYPIVTYDFSFTGRSAINAAFATKGITPNVVLTALDADVIKTYVAADSASGSWRWRGILTATCNSRKSMPHTCSLRARRGSPYGAAYTCVAMSTTSSPSSRRSSTERPSKPHCAVRPTTMSSEHSLAGGDRRA
jgi:LysR family cys regulon transcriptional activator